MFLALIGSIALPMPAADPAMAQPVDAASLAAVHTGRSIGHAGRRWTVPAPVSFGTEQLDQWWAEHGALLLANGIRPVTVNAAAIGVDLGPGGAPRIVLDVRITSAT